MDAATQWLKDNDPEYKDRRKSHGYMDALQMARARQKEIPVSALSHPKITSKLKITKELAEALQDFLT